MTQKRPNKKCQLLTRDTQKQGSLDWSSWKQTSFTKEEKVAIKRSDWFVLEAERSQTQTRVRAAQEVVTSLDFRANYVISCKFLRGGYTWRFNCRHSTLASILHAKTYSHVLFAQTRTISHDCESLSQTHTHNFAKTYHDTHIKIV